MKIVMKTQDFRFFLMIPTCLLLHRYTAFLIVRILRHQAFAITLEKEEILHMIYIVKQYKKKHRHWELIDIQSADGERIYIRI